MNMSACRLWFVMCLNTHRAHPDLRPGFSHGDPGRGDHPRKSGDRRLHGYVKGCFQILVLSVWTPASSQHREVLSHLEGARVVLEVCARPVLTLQGSPPGCPPVLQRPGVRPAEVMQLSEGRIRAGRGPHSAAATILGTLASLGPFELVFPWLLQSLCAWEALAWAQLPARRCQPDPGMASDMREPEGLRRVLQEHPMPHCVFSQLL